MTAVHHASNGEGEQLHHARSRRHVTVKGALFAVGLASGAWLGFMLARSGMDLSAPWPKRIAIGLAAIYVLALGVGSLLLNRTIDEVERARTYKAVTVAGSAYMIVYPVWFLLWKAQLAVEPIHWLLFVSFWLLLIGSSIFYRFR